MASGAGLRDVTTVVIAKEPRAGFAKTRMVPPLNAEQAAMLAAIALQTTLTTVSTLPGRHVLALEGSPGDWVPQGFEIVGQGSGSLGERLAHIVRLVGAPLIIVAMDTPQMTLDELFLAHTRLMTHDVVLGPTVDGGYWLIGLRVDCPEVFDDVPMSRSDTLFHQRQQAASLRLTCFEIATLRDLDTFDDVLALIAEQPTSPISLAAATLLEMTQ
jgi:uncharacterized protein